VRNLSQKFRGFLAQNNRRKEDSHPDFLAKLTIWNTTYSAAAWLSKTSKGDLYVAFRLSSEGQSQSEKIKLAIWRNHERSSVSDPHFESVQEIFGRDFVLQAWILASGDNYTLEITIEPSNTAIEVSDAVQDTKALLAAFLAQTRVAALPPAKEVPSRISDNSNDAEEGDIPF
jgi:hypothetical protein